MAHSLSSKKRIRQNAKRRARNRARKKEVKMKVRAFEATVSGREPGKAADTLRAAIKTLDRVADKGTIHKNTAARRKSRLQKRYNALAGAAS